MQVAGAAGKAVVRSLSGLDSWLENNKLLPELKPMAVPEPVQDEDGQLNQECQEVSPMMISSWALGNVVMCFMRTIASLH